MNVVDFEALQPERRQSAVEGSQQTQPCAAISTDSAGLGPFPHERLDAYRIALAMARDAKKLAEQIPRGQRSIADHLQRSSSNAVLLLAEERTNRRGAAEKRQRFVESRGEVGEAAAACDLIVALHTGSPAQAEIVKSYATRLAAMLTRLIQRQG